MAKLRAELENRLIAAGAKQDGVAALLAQLPEPPAEETTAAEQSETRVAREKAGLTPAAPQGPEATPPKRQSWLARLLRRNAG